MISNSNQDEIRAGYLFTIFVDFMTRCEFHPEALIILDGYFDHLEIEARYLIDTEPDSMCEASSLELVLSARRYVKVLMSEENERKLENIKENNNGISGS